MTIFNNDDLTKHDKIHIYVTNKNNNSSIYTIEYTNSNTSTYLKDNVKFCDFTTNNYCIKYYNSDNKIDYLFFTYDNLTNKGYPNTNIISINNKIIFKKKLINAEFDNFNIFNNILLFTYNNENEKNKLNLFALNTEGKVLIDKQIINTDLSKLFIYSMKVKENIIYVNTMIPNLSKENICKMTDDTIVEARYTISTNNGNLDNPIIKSKLSAKEYKIIMNIKC